ncbi:hypothetical protein THASP1DRAFT_33265 [Thamnocephalis sphaerospora]|uniref:Uncharacterized protein n=1 Tax=Thamnocephalis sphaerospora TaxID=78915 RepID=A0A4P9XGY5_9FUNG|nr:hypothetical protein THASP1DRAFT_33265 [Thamnocephalis sphaerospora]|eukprot:RKP04914.1 hypothetical protein THASP1DRAFT_33265 [Thamnocephalis sphaerospora]
MLRKKEKKQAAKRDAAAASSHSASPPASTADPARSAASDATATGEAALALSANLNAASDATLGQRSSTAAAPRAKTPERAPSSSKKKKKTRRTLALSTETSLAAPDVAASDMSRPAARAPSSLGRALAREPRNTNMLTVSTGTISPTAATAPLSSGSTTSGQSSLSALGAPPASPQQARPMRPAGMAKHRRTSSNLSVLSSLSINAAGLGDSSRSGYNSPVSASPRLRSVPIPEPLLMRPRSRASISSTDSDAELLQANGPSLPGSVHARSPSRRLHPMSRRGSASSRGGGAGSESPHATPLYSSGSAASSNADLNTFSALPPPITQRRRSSLAEVTFFCPA